MIWNKDTMAANSRAQDNGKLLEVIVCSLEDAFEAERGGGDRLEVVRELDRGGLTPSFELVRQMKCRVGVPMRVMLRESEQEDPPSRLALASLSRAVSELAEIGVHGVVLGYLRNGEVDTETVTQVLSAAPELRATFHHAFDNSRDPVEAIRRLHKIPQIDRVLTSGGSGNVLMRAARLNQYRVAAGTTPKILAGGGVTRKVLHDLSMLSSVDEFHVGRAAQNPRTGKVSASLVRQLKETLGCATSAARSDDCTGRISA